MVSSRRGRAPVVRLSGPGDVAAAIPQLLGFVPTQGVVAIATRGGRVGVTVRCDLAGDAGGDAVVAEVVVSSIARDGADAAIVAVFTDEAGDATAGLPRAPLVAAIIERTDAVVREAILVRRGRWWSYLCDDATCCPPDGWPVEATSTALLTLAAAQAVEGRAVLGDRDAVVASVAPITGVAAVSLDQALDRAAAAYAVDASAFLSDARALWTVLLARFGAPPAALTDDEAAAVVIAMHDVAFRDEAVVGVADNEDAARALLRALARRALPPLDAPVCTVLAWQTYCDGDGVLTRAALDRALVSDPAYPLARLLMSALDAMVHPRELHRLMRRARGPVAARSAARGPRGRRRSSR